jgi:putative ABC transport system substrate-binding protein
MRLLEARGGICGDGHFSGSAARRWHGRSLRALSGKRLELLREMLPRASAVAVLANPQNPEAAPSLKSTHDAAQALGVRLIVIEATTDRAIDEAFARLRQGRPDALVVLGDPFLTGRYRQIVALAAQGAIRRFTLTASLSTPAGSRATATM